MSATADGVRYRINADDEIVFVDAAWDWTTAALSVPYVPSHAVVGQVLWDFIDDGPTRQIYKTLVSRVRTGRVAEFTLRCDGASYRRLLRMTISADANGMVEFRTVPLETVERPPVVLLLPDVPRSTAMLRACGWCNRIDVGTEEWTEVEEAVERLRLFEQAAVPQLSHGVCEPCHAGLLETIASLERGD